MNVFEDDLLRNFNCDFYKFLLTPLACCRIVELIFAGNANTAEKDRYIVIGLIPLTILNVFQGGVTLVYNLHLLDGLLT